MNKSTIEKLAALCLERLASQGKTLNHVLKRNQTNPFPIGKTNLENLIYKGELSVKLQIKLAEYLGLKYKITLEE